MVKHILTLSLVAATATAVAANDAEKKQQKHQSRELEGNPVPTYYPTYWPTYSPTEDEYPADDGEKAAVYIKEVKEIVEMVKEIRAVGSTLPDPDEHEWGAPPAPLWDDDGWSSPSSGDDDGWSSWSSGKAGKSGRSGGKGGKSGSSGWKCSSKGGKVSLISISFGCILHVIDCRKACSNTPLVTYFIIFDSTEWTGKILQGSN